MNTALFCETTLLYFSARVGIRVLFFKAYKPAWRVRACARVCAVNVSHEEALMQPCETIATVNVEKMVNQKALCTKYLRVRCVGEKILNAVSLVRVWWQKLS